VIRRNVAKNHRGRGEIPVDVIDRGAIPVVVHDRGEFQAEVIDQLS